MRCLQCGKKLPKNRRKFCCNKHKDRWHNKSNPRGYYAHLSCSYSPKNNIVEYDINEWSNDDPIENDIHPQDSYCFGKDE